MTGHCATCTGLLLKETLEEFGPFMNFSPTKTDKSR